MADHQRTVIRHAIVAALAGATSAGTRVRTMRVLPERFRELPLINVWMDDESSEDAGDAPRQTKRTLPVAIQAFLQASTDGDPMDAVDALALQIETAMAADPFFDGQVEECVETGTEFEVLSEGERLILYFAIVYSVTYRTFAPETQADADTDDFVTVGADYQTGDEVAHDVFDLLEVES